MQCAICGAENDIEIISHLRNDPDHDLRSYLNTFPDLPVCTRELFTAIENLTYFGFADDTPGLDSITAEERELILVSARNNAYQPSLITISPDF